MKTTAIYLRVSSANGQKFDSQWEDLNKWIELHKPEKTKIYEDKFTGTTMSRPEMDKLMVDLHNGNLNSIVCWRLDRLGRTAAGLTKLFEDLRQYKCNLISLKDNLDFSTPSGRLNANIIASVAAYETEVRAERVRAGQQAAKSKGKCWGGSKKGIRRSRISEKLPAIVQLHMQGMNKSTIARSVNVSIPTITSIIQNTVL